MAIKFVGLGYGVRIFFKADGSPDWRGAPRQEVLNLAEAYVKVMTGEKLEFVRNWINLATKEGEAEGFEKNVEKELAKRPLLDKLPGYAREPAESAIREQIRRKLAGG
jgi:hypothetical protein